MSQTERVAECKMTGPSDWNILANSQNGFNVLKTDEEVCWDMGSCKSEILKMNLQLKEIASSCIVYMCTSKVCSTSKISLS